MISVNPANSEILEHHTPLTQSQILNKIMKTVTGKIVPKEIWIEINDLANMLTYNHLWKKNDFIMIRKNSYRRLLIIP